MEMDYLAHAHLLKTRLNEGKKEIWCCIRKKYLIMQPEEMVRQLVLLYLIENRHFNKNRIAVEKQLTVNGQKRRFDILLFDESANPWLLIECKAPKIAIDQAVFNQIAQYNLFYKVPYLMVTNGRVNYCSAIDFENKDYSFLEDLPL